MSHLIITSNTTNMMTAMTTTSAIVAPAATGTTDEPVFKTKWYLYNSIYKHVSASTNNHYRSLQLISHN